APDRMLVGVERRMVGEADPQRRDLHARDDGTKRRLQQRVVEQRLEKARDELDDLAIDRLACARDERRAMLIEAAATEVTRPGAVECGLTEQLVEPHQRLFEAGIALRGGVARCSAQRAGPEDAARCSGRTAPAAVCG